MIEKISRLKFYLLTTLCAAALLLLNPVANAQETASNKNAATAAAGTTLSNNKNTSTTGASPAAASPVFTDYRGIMIGMSADDVRNKLNHLKEKGKLQDFFVFSDAESAQVFYDDQGKVMAVAVTYLADDHNAPSAKAVLGEDIQAKPDGSMYELRRYPAAGYWIAYSRTAGKSPIITVTMQKIQ